MNKTRSIIFVCDLIKAHAHLKSGLSEIDETESIFERSYSIQIGEVADQHEDGSEHDGLFPEDGAGFNHQQEQPESDHERQARTADLVVNPELDKQMPIEEKKAQESEPKAETVEKGAM